LINYYKLVKKHIHLIINIKIRNISKLIKFYKSYKKYRRLNGVEELSISDFYPCISDNTSTTPFDAHCFYQGVWALRKIKVSRDKNHLEVGSEIR
jgi:hypothetical protein